ncbi:MAG: serine hydrolase, partial [Pseudomonadota bacterium]
TPFGELRIRDVLDHASGLDCGDEYDDRQSCYYQYSMAIGDGHRDAKAPDNPYDFLATLKVKKLHEPGTHFSYSGTNNFVLMWLLEEISGQTFNDLFSDMFWRHIGAEADAGLIAYRYGISLSHGGFFSNMRDLARFGLLYTPSYQVISDKKIISDEHIAFMNEAGRPELYTNIGVPVAGSPNAPEPAIKHNIYQWGAVYTNGAMVHGGWGGQGLITNPVNDTVAVFTAYFPEDGESANLETIILQLLADVFPE